MTAPPIARSWEPSLQRRLLGDVRKWDIALSPHRWTRSSLPARRASKATSCAQHPTQRCDQYADVALLYGLVGPSHPRSRLPSTAWRPPVLFLHMVLLPLNIVRLAEIVRATRATGGLTQSDGAVRAAPWPISSPFRRQRAAQPIRRNTVKHRIARLVAPRRMRPLVAIPTHRPLC